MNLKEFAKIFLFRESLNILKNKGLLLFSLIVLTMALCTLGFNEATIDLLGRRMSSPFARFIEFTVPGGKSKDLENLKSAIINAPDNSNHGIESFSDVYFDYRDFLGLDSSIISAKVRSIDLTGDLYPYLIGGEGVDLLGKHNANLENSPFSIIVSKDFLSLLGIVDTPVTLNYVVSLDRESDKPKTIPVSVLFVASELPDKSDIVMSSTGYRSFMNGCYGKPFLDFRDTALERRFFVKSRTDVNRFSKELGEFCTISTGINLRIAEDNDHIYEGFSVIISSSIQEELNELESCLQAFCSSKFRYEFHRLQNLEEKDTIKCEEGRVQKLWLTPLNMENLESLSVFVRGYGFEAEMRDLDSLKNLNIFVKISQILSVILSVLAVLLIVVINSRMITDAIARNSEKLGTLKAFGLDSYIINLVFCSLSSLMILITFMISFSAAMFIGPFLFSGENISMDLAGEEVFNLSLSFFLIAVFIIIPTGVVALIVSRKLHGKTPGDLVYGR